jgi:hypothetical protein
MSSGLERFEKFCPSGIGKMDLLYINHLNSLFEEI